MAIVDQFGNPIAAADIKALQTVQTQQQSTTATVGQRLGALRYLSPTLTNLTPARLHNILRAADMGDLYQQHRLFSDMLDHDEHLRGEFEKRTMAITKAEWRIEPPRNASAQEVKLAAWLDEVLRSLPQPVEDLFIGCMDAIGHGFATAELEWKAARVGGETLQVPRFHMRPQEWFRLDAATRTELRLVDGTLAGTALRPFGWVWHMAGQPKTGYAGRMGLMRCLVWPFIYKHYGLGDFAEYLEIYGLPIIMGKHPSTASDAEKESLYQAVIALGHDARAIMPAEMSIELAKVAAGGGDGGHLAMVAWAEKAVSKAVLGGTLTSQADGKTSTNALGNVHNEVRMDIARADARNLAATLRRDLIYPLLAINRGLTDLSRTPQIVFDFAEPADLAQLAEALPKVAAVIDIPKAWAYKKLGIPMPAEGEEVLKLAAPTAPTAPTAPVPPASAGQALSLHALSAAPMLSDPISPTQAIESQLVDLAAPHWAQVFGQVQALVAQHDDLQQLQVALTHAYGALDAGDLQQLMTAAFALATLKGLDDAQASARRLGQMGS